MSAVLALAGSAGVKVVAKILSQKFGETTGQIAADVLSAVAERVGVPVDALEAEAEANPAVVTKALIAVEGQTPDLLALYASGLELQKAALAAEAGDPLWMRAWRPAGVWLIFALWVWNAVILHALNAVFKSGLPSIPYDYLMQLSALFLGLYMGGHTVKDALSKWGGK